MTARTAHVALLLLATAAFSCASAPHWEDPGAASAARDRDAVNVMNEGIGSQGRQLVAAQSEGAPNCARIAQLVSNICSLSERICTTGSRYPTTDPMANDCVDGRARCEQARMSSASCASR